MAVKAAVNAGNSASTASAAACASTNHKASIMSTVAGVATLLAGLIKLLSGDGATKVALALMGTLTLGAMFVPEDMLNSADLFFSGTVTGKRAAAETGGCVKPATRTRYVRMQKLCSVCVTECFVTSWMKCCCPLLSIYCTVGPL
jgi:hypothetical protein